jgi:hypothetical protein
MKRILTPILLVILATTLFAQAKKKPTKKTTKPKTTVSTTAGTAPKTAAPKANQRPEDVATTETVPTEKRNSRPGIVKPKEEIYEYYYEFTQPQFTISKLIIEHHENGKGRVRFQKQDWDDMLSDPIQLSDATLAKLNGWFQSLNFLDSTEEYQSERHYAHLGVMKLRVKKDGKQREITLDWTNNKDAKSLLDEYRKLSEEFTWIFDMNVAKENQPLEAPKLMEGIESVVSRDGISDPIQFAQYLKKLSLDERIPLIARNKAKRLSEKLEKSKK